MTLRPDPHATGYYTVPEVARMLRVSEWYVRERIADGSLPATVLRFGNGRRIFRIRTRDFEAFRARFTGSATDRRFE